MQHWASSSEVPEGGGLWEEIYVLSLICAMSRVQTLLWAVGSALAITQIGTCPRLLMQAFRTLQYVPPILLETPKIACMPIVTHK